MVRRMAQAKHYASKAIRVKRIELQQATAAKLRVNGRWIQKYELNIVTVRLDCNKSLEEQEEMELINEFLQV